MSNKINLMWLSEKNNDFIIGQILNYQGRFYFSYNQGEVKKAIDEGFNVLDGFPRVNSKYFSEEIFKLFAGWVNEHQKFEKVNFEMLKGLNYGQFMLKEVNENYSDESLA